MKKTKGNSEKYIWGDNCTGWHLVKSEELGIIQEEMPVGTAEKRHYHKNVTQFFFILKGSATFEIESEEITVDSGEGILIEKGKKHKILNKGKERLEFIVTSQPHSHNDRIDLE